VPEALFLVDVIQARLRDGPRRIEAAAGVLTSEQLKAPEREGEWSAVEVLAHLRACGDVWGGNLLRILAEDHPNFRALSPRTWMKRTDYPQLDFAPSFESFKAQRAELLATLESLPPEAWARSATRIDMVSKSREVTVHYYADSLARHEAPHLKQIERIAKTLRT
jgi:hypothetical protein